MQHLRIISPSERTDAVAEVLAGHHGVANVVVLTDAARKPAGDLIQCDVAREAVNELLDSLDSLGIDDDGSITMERVDLSISRAAADARAAAPGEDEDAVVWGEFAQRVDDSSRLTWSFVAFLAIATQIAAIGVLLDSPIMIVGAMVLGPEFGPVAAIGYGLLRREWWRLGIALRTLGFGFAAAIAVTWACAFVSSLLGWIDPSWLEDAGRETAFIVKPDKWSLIVAVLAGVAGVLSLTSDKSSALVGVFISVTTVPAAAYIAVSVALRHWSEVPPSIVQLGINLSGLTVASTATLIVLRLLWGRAGLSAKLGD